MVAPVARIRFVGPSSSEVTMGTVEKYLAGAGALIAIYLVVANASGSDTVLRGLGSFNVGTIKALQGR